MRGDHRERSLNQHQPNKSICEFANSDMITVTENGTSHSVVKQKVPTFYTPIDLVTTDKDVINMNIYR